MRVNLVLSGGAARGIAHIGVIKALEELGFSIKALSGVSAGSIVAVFYSYGYTPEDMLKLVKETRWFSLFRPKIPRSGLFSFKRAEKYLKELIPVDRLERLPRRVYICATDLLSARSFYFKKGELVPVLLGSCALPGIFEPVKYERYVLIDGGVMNNLPVEPFERYRTPKIGVDVNPIERIDRVGNIVNVLIRSFFLAVRSNVDKRKELCDLVITPDIVKFSPLDVRKADELYALGYKKTMTIMKKFIKEAGF
ncbi:patatin-like phospholipase family protein [Hydrogenivirga sp. 128-5-R1-1]|uniref:patatin-like phospholipase family protein n=1 Tax=Hydrogenivirga sp. 128-5-R1-1 TaxID=392423 RepID=UPI00015EF87A|nr:patatin-like phospholipase family protein [Hydrogenivirga sp. 128-5-R1-1]EDP75623.1 translation-associated GTPase [Hydrogenivirga sp. 128-5-R1-1]